MRPLYEADIQCDCIIKGIKVLIHILKHCTNFCRGGVGWGRGMCAGGGKQMTPVISTLKK